MGGWEIIVDVIWDDFGMKSVLPRASPHAGLHHRFSPHRNLILMSVFTSKLQIYIFIFAFHVSTSLITRLFYKSCASICPCRQKDSRRELYSIASNSLLLVGKYLKPSQYRNLERCSIMHNKATKSDALDMKKQV